VKFLFYRHVEIHRQWMQLFAEMIIIKPFFLFVIDALAK
jgi:hypothetical protein